MIRVDWAESLCRITIDRADKAGALTRAMLTDLAEAVQSAQSAQALVLTGTGKVFSAGMDLEEAKTDLPTDPVWERLSGAIASHPGLTVAALNGTVAGGAMGMALACDLRIAADHAKVFYPVMKLGFAPQPSDPARLAALVGPARAKLILMGGAKVPAAQALAMGLFDQLVPAADLDAAVQAITLDALNAAPEHVHRIKAMIPS